MNEDILIIGSILAIFAFLVLTMIYTKRKDRAKYKSKLDDEFLYESDIGRKLTLEEAEKGIVMDSFDEEDFKKDYLVVDSDEDSVELKYVNEFLTKQNIEPIGDEDYWRLKEMLMNFDFVKTYKSFKLNNIIQINKNGFIAVYEIKYDVHGGRLLGNIHEYQMIGIIENAKPIGESTIQPYKASNIITNKLTPEEEIIVEGNNVRPFSNLNESNLSRLCKELNKFNKDYIVETFKSLILIRYHNRLVLDCFKKMVEIIQKYVD